MRDFSIELQSEKIYSAKTRDYFQEVIKSYYSESYRSAVVMLYSIAVADLLYKIEELHETYSDPNATKILEEIKTLQTKNSVSAEWETKLIDLIKDKTNLLEPSDYLHINTLRQHRHLCAHPVLTQNFELYRPNKETTRAHIRNILEGVLIKPPFLSRKIFEDLLENLSSIKTIIYDEIQLERHLKAKYLDKINPKVTLHIFRSLWKVTFKTSNQLCDDNREINLRAILIILKTDYKNLITTIATEQDYYSDLDEKYLMNLITLFNQFPEIFKVLNDSAKILIQNIIEKDADLDTYAVFLSENITAHINKISSITWESGYEETHITTESILYVFNYANREGNRNVAFDFLIEMFGKSHQYSIADMRFDHLIRPFLNEFDKDEIRKIVKVVNSNSQIHDRREARSSNYHIRNRIEELYGATFDFKMYSYFK
ncbi:hypothetical protein [Flavobacterium sp. AG291]|uniref:hypothetical protein n=1 Tax=Flavobacterium sp. AG291 TaxID=2184000 RepID=UPI000E2CB11B|nr:hypothetical protein [Flavobacterium sp. AG291]RDI06686.1 hypothetical protein DEU42_11431 [Flavobacterium sp. AG291]